MMITLSDWLKLTNTHSTYPLMNDWLDLIASASPVAGAANTDFIILDNGLPFSDAYYYLPTVLPEPEVIEELLTRHLRTVDAQLVCFLSCSAGLRFTDPSIASHFSTLEELVQLPESCPSTDYLKLFHAMNGDLVLIHREGSYHWLQMETSEIIPYATDTAAFLSHLIECRRVGRPYESWEFLNPTPLDELFDE